MPVNDERIIPSRATQDLAAAGYTLRAKRVEQVSVVHAARMVDDLHVRMACGSKMGLVQMLDPEWDVDCLRCLRIRRSRG